MTQLNFHRTMSAWKSARRTDRALGIDAILLRKAGVIARTLPGGGVIWKDVSVHISSSREMCSFLINQETKRKGSRR